MKFLVPASGAVIGLLIGVTIGGVFPLFVEGSTFDLTYVGGMVGVILGYFVGHMIERQNQA